MPWVEGPSLDPLAFAASVEKHLPKAVDRAVGRWRSAVKAGLLGKKLPAGAVMVRTADYVNSWTYRVVGMQSVTIGPEGQHHSGLSNQDLARSLEYGTATSKAIPHVRTMDRYLKSIASDLGRNVAKDLFGVGK